jgi:hypothetical protein
LKKSSGPSEVLLRGFGMSLDGVGMIRLWTVNSAELGTIRLWAVVKPFWTLACGAELWLAFFLIMDESSKLFNSLTDMQRLFFLTEWRDGCPSVSLSPNSPQNQPLTIPDHHGPSSIRSTSPLLK